MNESERFIREVCESMGHKELERELGLPKDWVITVAGEDDWSFIIKAHALLEAAANYALERNLGKKELGDIIARLEFSGTRTGKITILDALGVLDSDCKRFCLKLSEIRNVFVHDIKNVNVDFDKFIADLVESERKGFEKAFRWNISDWKAFDWSKIVNEDSRMFFSLAASSWERSKKLSIWFGVLFIIKRLNQ